MKTFLISFIRTGRLQGWKEFLSPKLHRIAEFLTLQGITTAGNLFYGFLCVRLLPIPDYAEFAVVFGFLGTLTVLMDIGISSTLVPLVGERIDDRQLIADYIASLRQLAHWLYIAVAPLVVLIYPLIVRRQQWSWRVVTAMLAILLVAGWFARVSGAYGAVLIIRRDRAVWYRTQMISSLGTLVLLGVVWSLHRFGAFSAILINVAGIIFTATAYYLRSRRLLGVKGHPSRQKRREIVHLSMPTVPGAIFYAFQGQISIFLITVFGHTTAVAGLGALSRLSRVFILFAQMNPLLIEPYFARLPRTLLKRNYAGAVATGIALCMLVTALAHFVPELFLWVLGPKYRDLRVEVFILLASSSAGYLTELLWAIHNARRFVYWWNAGMTVTCTSLVEIIFVWRENLSTVRNVLVLGLIVALSNLAINAFTGLYGFTKGAREVRGPRPEVPASAS